jgi:hypothetical protein
VRRAARKDGNHTAIVDAFKSWGATVVVLEPRPEAPGISDLLVGIDRENHLVEVKMPGRKLREEQARFVLGWKGERPYMVSHEREVAALVDFWRRRQTS